MHLYIFKMSYDLEIILTLKWVISFKITVENVKIYMRKLHNNIDPKDLKKTKNNLIRERWVNSVRRP